MKLLSKFLLAIIMNSLKSILVGVVDVHASHVDKTVTVTGTASDSDIIAAIKKTGKDAIKF